MGAHVVHQGPHLFVLRLNLFRLNNRAQSPRPVLATKARRARAVIQRGLGKPSSTIQLHKKISVYLKTPRGHHQVFEILQCMPPPLGAAKHCANHRAQTAFPKFRELVHLDLPNSGKIKAKDLLAFRLSYGRLTAGSRDF